MKSSLTKDQQMAYDYMMKGENVFLTGEAGTGKSFVINHFIEVMKEKIRMFLYVLQQELQLSMLVESQFIEVFKHP